MLSVLHSVLVVFKFIFGLGALLTLLGSGALLTWFALHLIVRFALRHQPADHSRWLRQLFLESTPARRLP